MALSSLKDGWRRTKQVAKVKLGKADETHDDEDFDQLVVQCKDHHALLKKVNLTIAAHVTALKQATSSGNALATELNELYSDSGAEHRPTVIANSRGWHDAGVVAVAQLDTSFEIKVVEPLVSMVIEFDTVAKMWEERRKRRQDFDYYRGKTSEMEKKRGEKNMDEKIMRNEQKLEQTGQLFRALTDETRTRMRELISERFAFYGGPLTQLMAIERGYHAGVAKALEPLSQWTSDAALDSAQNVMAARPSRRRPTLTLDAILAGEAPLPGEEGGREERSWSVDEDRRTAPVVSMDDMGGERSRSNSEAAPTQAHNPPAYQQPAQAADPWASAPAKEVDLLSDPFADVSIEQPAPQQASNNNLLDPFSDAVPSNGGDGAVFGADKFQALCDYAPGDPRMLALKKGDQLTKEKEEDGWFFGRNDRSGESGYFPPNYCKKS
ncbi:hypothetical protein T492DRAFT_1052197 [Pavlovales sp. CCMP2436]|nr:hypothetical protein T492DRAFT_1052197 [Pavlovales sp. CCMP2436]